METCQTGPPRSASIQSQPESMDSTREPTNSGAPKRGCAVSQAKRHGFWNAVSCCGVIKQFRAVRVAPEGAKHRNDAADVNPFQPGVYEENHGPVRELREN